MILVIGARSAIGSELVRLLQHQGVATRVLSRTPAPASASGPEVVRGDLDDVASLRAAMDGASSVFLLSSPGERQGEQHAGAIDAAREAGVGHLVRLSILGSDPEAPCAFRRMAGVADAHLAASGVPFTVLRPNYFQQNVPDRTVPSLQADAAGGLTLYASAGDAALSMVDTRDVAAAALAVLMSGSEHHGQGYDLCGPEALDHGAVASRLTRRLGRTVTHVDVTEEQTRDALLAAGLSGWLAGALADLYEDYRRSGRDGYAAAVPPDLERLTGRPPRTLDALLDERLGSS